MSSRRKKRVRFNWMVRAWVENDSPLALPHHTYWWWSYTHKSWLVRYVPV